MLNPCQNHRPTESTHPRLIEFAKVALINIFVSPYATVCDLFCGKVTDEERWEDAQIGQYIGIDVVTTGVSEVREAWKSRSKTYTFEFLELDPCVGDVELHWKDKEKQADIVFCMQHLPLCFETEEKVRRLLHNVSSLLRPGGYFLGLTPGAQLAEFLMDSGPNLTDPRGRLLPRSYDLLVLYTTFIFQKPDPDISPPRMNPLLEDGNHNLDEIFFSYEQWLFLMAWRDWPGMGRREEEKIVQAEPTSGLGKMSEQKGIIGPGPAELRFPEAL